MSRYIEIAKGNEYKPMKEKTLQKNMFFEEVYKRANAIVYEIIMENRDFPENGERTGCYRKRIQDVGNNIVAFCAGRGQGKTSAMQSYAAYLSGEISVDGNEMAEKDFFGEEMINRKEFCFKVLEPIDLSSLDYAESIIRVLISRLFNEFVQIGENDEIPFADEKVFRKERDIILKLFKRCYENIDYLKKGERIEQDDLEVLAQLGSSAELKENLYELIKCFLQMAFWKKKEKIETKGYLVIQIDDADLSLGNIFEVCENIRNYFSIPNVIVLMAADYKQLKTAIHQKYLEQYERMIKLQSQSKYYDDCNIMAAKYLEKMLPAGHRVRLPQMDVVINENFQLIKVKYYKRKGGDLFEAVAKECKDMQEQLMKLLYLKTGVILLKREGELHPFLPHTLRELTQFIRMLDDMETVDQREAFRIMIGSENHREVEKLKANLEILKAYFLNYWCGNHLNDSQQKLIDEIDDANMMMKTVYNNIKEYLKHNEIAVGSMKDVTYKKILHEIIESRMSEEPELQEAIYLYYTIALNKWFARAIQDQGQFKSIAEFIGNPLDISEEFISKRYAKKYYVMNFTISVEKLKGFLTEKSMLEGQVSTWLETFCTPKAASPDNDKEAQEMIETIDGKRVWNEEVTELQFDILRPILSMLVSKRWLEGDGKAADDEESDRDAVHGQEKEILDDMSYLVSVKNIIANYEVQRCVQQKIERECRNFSRRSTIKEWRKIYGDIYGKIDAWVSEEAAYLDEASVIKEKCSAYLDNAYMGEIVFLCNDDNEKQYIADYRTYLTDITDKVIGGLAEIGKNNAQEKAGEKLQQMINKEGNRNYVGIIKMQGELPNNTMKKLTDIDQKIGKTLNELTQKVMEASEKKEDLEGIIMSAKNKLAGYKSQLILMNK